MNQSSFDPVSRFHFLSSIDMNSLPLAVQKSITAHQHRLAFKKNEVIYGEGSYPKGIYMIRKGIVKALHLNHNGSTQIIYFYIRDEIFGYRPLLCRDSHPFTAVALEPVLLDFIPSEQFLPILDSSKELGKQLLFTMGKEFSMWVNRINVFAQRNVHQRLALALLILNEKFANPLEENNTIKLTKTDLGNYIGTSIEVIHRTLKEFEKSGLVLVQGKQIKIKNKLKLYSEAGIY